MTDELHRPQRKSIRLSPASYRQRQAYFVTVCTHAKQCLLSVVEGQSVQLLNPGQIIQSIWVDLPRRFAGLTLHEYIIMPNHLHGILSFVGAGLARPASHAEMGSPALLGRAEQATPLEATRPDMSNALQPYSLSDVMRVFKSVSTIEMNRALRTPGKRLWQRSYFDHVIRDAEDMQIHQRYILENPMRWAATKYPSSSGAPPQSL